MPIDPHDPLYVFTRAVERWPERRALEVRGAMLTYRQLDLLSTAMAHDLVTCGATGQRIAFVAHKNDHSTYVNVLAILKAGASCVPLPPDGPVYRWIMMVERCEARFAIGSPEPSEVEQTFRNGGHALQWVQAASSAQRSRGEMRAEIAACAEAYVMFTSGSTGGPKGVSVSRANLSSYLRNFPRAYTFTQEDRFTQHFALAFDLSVHDLFVCWSHGACLCVPPDQGGLRAAAWARQQQITVWFSVPSLVAVMRRARTLGADALPDLRYAFFCGEALHWDLLASIRAAAPHARLINLYGPTEATIAITHFEVDGDMTGQGVVPIGRPFVPGQAIVMPTDEADGSEGELLLSGDQIAAGYVNAAESTAKAFVHLPDQAGRWYRTGDRARLDGDGVLHFMGRIDHQVKVLGHRMEPGEVDEALSSSLNGGNAVTVPYVHQGVTRLVTFVDVPVDHAWALEQLRMRLPAPFVPERIVVLDEIPRTSSGKWDRTTLIRMAQDEA